jgi:hypothetical protein
MLTLVANSLGASEAADNRLPGKRILPSFRLTRGVREFASSINVDTGGEFIFLSARELREDQGSRE